MKDIVKIFTLIAIIGTFSSCKEDVQGVIWGETEYYSDFIGYNYSPVIMEKVLELEFNDDAKRLIHNPVEFEVVELSEDGFYVKAEDIKVYKNGELCSENQFSIATTDTEVTIGIEFLPEASEGFHKVYIHERNLRGLDRVDYTEFGDGIVVKKENIINPLAWWLGIVLASLILIYLVWYVVVIAQKPKVSRILLDYGDGCRKRIDMGGSYELVCTSNRRMKDGFFRKIFQGTRKFEYNDFWTHTITIAPVASKATSSIRVTPLKDFCINGNLKRKETFEIENADGSRKVIITTT